MGMEDFDAGYNGLFQNAAGAFADPFGGKNIYLYASNGSDFTNASAEYLIYKFSATFTADPFNGEQLLGTSAGSLLVGGYNNYSFDYSLGGGALPAFNTVAAVPEPTTWMLLVLGVTFVLWRKRQRA